MDLVEGTDGVAGVRDDGVPHVVPAGEVVEVVAGVDVLVHVADDVRSGRDAGGRRAQVASGIV